MKKMQQILKQDRPREKLQAKGAAALSDFELLQALKAHNLTYVR